MAQKDGARPAGRAGMTQVEVNYPTLSSSDVSQLCVLHCRSTPAGLRQSAKRVEVEC